MAPDKARIIFVFLPQTEHTDTFDSSSVATNLQLAQCQLVRFSSLRAQTIETVLQAGHICSDMIRDNSELAPNDKLSGPARLDNVRRTRERRGGPVSLQRRVRRYYLRSPRNTTASVPNFLGL